jgi:hypothetical protein
MRKVNQTSETKVMKKIVVILFFTLGCMGLGISQDYSPYYPQQQQPSTDQQGVIYGQQNGQQGQMQPQFSPLQEGDHLSTQEQAFAAQLSPIHKTMFCRHFSVAQRIEAMTLASSQVQGIDGQMATISPDEAVEIVMKNARQEEPSTPSQGQMYPSQGQTYPSGTTPYCPSNGNRSSTCPGRGY